MPPYVQLDAVADHRATRKTFKFVTCLLLVSCIGACGGNRPAPASNDDGKTEREPWFCQTGAARDAWECVQDEALAAKPQPIRKPPQPEQPGVPAARSPESLTPPVSNAPTQSAPPLPSVRPEVSTQARNAEAKAAEAARAAQAAKEAQAQRQRLQDLPPHIRLAYRPDKPTSIIDLPDEFWAVQLIALSSKEALEKYARDYDLKGMSAAQIGVDGKPMYILLLGIYETRAFAEEASQNLPPPFDQPWIRPLKGLKQAMIAGEAIIASN